MGAVADRQAWLAGYFGHFGVKIAVFSGHNLAGKIRRITRIKS